MFLGLSDDFQAAGLSEAVVMFLRDVSVQNQATIHLFSVASAGHSSVKYRSIVYHEGSDDGSGSWSCSRDGKSQCGHITSARHHLQRLVHVDPYARDPFAGLEAFGCGM